MNVIRGIPKRYIFSSLAFLILILLAAAPSYVPSYILILLTSIFLYVILGISWNTFCGPTGYISLATAAFFGVGVYTSAVLQKLPLPIIIIIGGLVSLFLGLVVGWTTLRLKGMYFAIFTFGLSELLRHAMIWYEVNITCTVGRWLPLQSTATVYWCMLFILVAAVLTAYSVIHSRFGLALRSIGQSEEAAAHLGINVNTVKIVIFAMTCFFMGAAGVVMSTRWSYIDPHLAFSPTVTFFTVMMVLFGGWKSTLWGPIIGATILTVLADTVLANFPDLTMFLFGLLLFVLIMFLPNGLMGIFQRKGKVREITVTK
jgi:branched-chain amino acid transport system permease protein